MVVVNLYPFEETVAQEGVTLEQARAQIDIGGVSLLRAAAKNYLRVAPLSDPRDYEGVLAFLRANEGGLSLARRFELARKAFAHTAAYDGAISRYLEGQDPAGVGGVYDLQGQG
jgi:phosphoribosylaminoimidazolecarboxamide formyltransferase/IMP cyclohydrolase